MRTPRRLRRSERGGLCIGEKGVLGRKEEYAGILASKGKGTGQAEKRRFERVA